MTQSFFVNGPLPGLNEMLAAAKGYKGTGRAYSALKRAWTSNVAWAAKAARLRPVNRAMFAFRWVEKDRRRNPDNVAAGGRKVVLDGLVWARVLANDGWGEIAGWSDSFDVGEKPGVWVTIAEV